MWPWLGASCADDPWYFEQSRGEVRIRRAGQRLFALQRRPHFIVSQRCRQSQRVRGRWHRGGVDVLKLFGIAENAGELAGEQLELVGGEIEPRELSDAGNVIWTKGGWHFC